MNASYPLRDELLLSMEQHAETFLRRVLSFYGSNELRISFADLNRLTPKPLAPRSVATALLRARATSLGERRAAVEDAYHGTVSVVVTLYTQTRQSEAMSQLVERLAEEYFRIVQTQPAGGWCFDQLRRIAGETTTTGKTTAWSVDGHARWRLPDSDILIDEESRFPLLHDEDLYPLEAEAP